MVAEEVFSSMRTVHAFGGQEKEAQRYLRNLADASKFGTRKSFISGFSQGMTWLIIFCDWGLGLWYGGRLVRHDDYSVSDMMTVFFSAFIGCFSLGLAAPAFVIVTAGRGAAYSIYQILDRKSEIDSSSTVGLKPATMTGRIQFKGLHFSYPARSSVKILNGIDITVNQGQTVALVGSSGCGKSTLIQLLLRFYDADMGKVCLDGVDIRDINIKWLRQSIGHVGQEPVLFATSILENIRYGREGATMEEVVQASKDANAYDFIMKMPEKFETHVGERGAQLSGGQKQRIAIARALVKNPRVLLLDEATSALDNASEAVVQDALDRASKGRTTVVIAHRLSTIRQADVIVALDKGKVAERGTHEELMSKQGIYFHLVSNQRRCLMVLIFLISLYADLHIFVTCLSMERVSVSVTPRFLAEGESVMSELPIDIEEGANGGRAKRTVKRLLKMNGTEWHYIVMGSVASFINGALQPAWAVVLSEMIKVKYNFSYLIITFVMILILICHDYICDYLISPPPFFFLQDYMFGLAGEALTLRMRDLLFRTILRQNIGWFDDRRHETGVLTTQLAVETSVVQGAVKTLVGCMWLCFGNLGTGFVISLIFGWQLALALMGFVPFIVMAGLLSIKFLGGAANESKTAMEDASKNALSCIDNIRTVAALTREEIFLAKFAHSLWEPFRNNVKTSIIAAGAFGFSFGIYYITFAVCFYYGSRLLKDDDIDYNDIFKVFGCVILGAMQFGRSVAFAPDANAAIKAARRIFALHDRTPPIDAYSDAGVRPSPDFKSTVRFADAFFRYPMRPDAVVLNGLNMSVEPGQTLALVGESGCGKSTTVQLIERFYDPEKGSVVNDKYDIKDLNIPWLRLQIGLVSQEPVLFDRSVSENIAYGDNSRKVNMEEIIQAARDANIHNFIEALPCGYETNVGSKGTQLSGGQKQRIAIARALVRNPKILLLDEATSALDTESEKVVQEALDKARKGRTCIVIAHRLSTITSADTIAVLKKGVIHEIGTHRKLMAKRGLYYQLQMTQTG
ncbi:unnamed protein product [Lymnaea stagnalis]|uniref:Uncharacterized protein n=1 Tax=Lymnaea stagnalis TaxID=6523 RepID=A0AAV2HPQ8_LYMST